MKFLVTRNDLITGDRMAPKNRSFWPVVVEADDHESAVEVAYRRFPDWNGNLPLDRPFLVVAMQDACIVTLKPKPAYEITVTPVYYA